MDPFEAFVAGFVLPKKEAFSRQVNAQLPKLALPKLGQAGPDGRVSMATLKAINDQLGKLRYNMDPNGGLTDYYNHPGYTQWLLQNQKWDQPCDCDDFATYAVALLWACGMAQSKAWVWNLIIHPGLQISQMWANHVVAACEYWDGSKIWTAVLDTNTAAYKQIFWVPKPADQAIADVLAHYGGIYRVGYYKAIRVPFPF